MIASILTGSFVIEKIFAIPGMGRLIVHSIMIRDFVVVQGVIFVVAVAILVLNLVTDIFYAVLDPRIRYA